VWAQKLAEVDLKRSRFQDMAAEGLISFDELKAKLAELKETREGAKHEVNRLERSRERIAQLELGKEELLKSYAEMVPDGLDTFTPEERHHQVYRRLRLRVLAYPDGKLEANGAFGTGIGRIEEEILDRYRHRVLDGHRHYAFVLRPGGGRGHHQSHDRERREQVR
jgi:hypothetical protein